MRRDEGGQPMSEYSQLRCPTCDWSPPETIAVDLRGDGHGDVLTREARLLEYIVHLLENPGHNAWNGPQGMQR